MVEINDEMNVIVSTWAFKLKQFTDELINKSKGHFYDRSNHHLEGVDLFET